MPATKKQNAPKKPATKKSSNTSSKPATTQRVPRIANAIGRGLKAQADAQPAKKRKEWVRPTAAEMKSVKEQLATAETQLASWRDSAKQYRVELSAALEENEGYQETHTLHNVASLVLGIVLVVSLGFNLWG